MFISLEKSSGEISLTPYFPCKIILIAVYALTFPAPCLWVNPSNMLSEGVPGKGAAFHDMMPLI